MSDSPLRRDAAAPSIDDAARRLGRARATAPTSSGTGSTTQRRAARRRHRRSRSALRARLADALPLALDPVAEQTAHDGMTTKWLWPCARDGAQIETVLMRYPERATVCVSSQAGCAMGCTFCATGQAGFERHLDAGEIVEQVRARRARRRRSASATSCSWAWASRSPTTTTTWAAVDRLHDDLGISARHLTVSTVGVVPGMRRLAQERPAGHARGVAPRRHRRRLRESSSRSTAAIPIAEVLDAAAEFAGSKGRRVTFEYACIAGVNDSPAQAEALGRCWGVPGRGRRPRQPDPPQPHRRLRRSRARTAARSGPSPTSCGATA